MPQRLVLDAAADLIEPLVRRADHVERVGDLLGVGQHRVGHRPVGAGQVEGDPLDPAPPALGSGGEPFARTSGVTALDQVQELVVTDQLGGPRPMAIGPDTDQRGLVQP